MATGKQIAATYQKLLTGVNLKQKSLLYPLTYLKIHHVTGIGQILYMLGRSVYVGGLGRGVPVYIMCVGCLCVLNIAKKKRNLCRQTQTFRNDVVEHESFLSSTTTMNSHNAKEKMAAGLYSWGYPR